MADEVDYEAVVMDAGYGELRPFLHELDRRKITFVAQVPESHCFWPADIEVDKVQKAYGQAAKIRGSG